MCAAPAGRCLSRPRDLIEASKAHVARLWPARRGEEAHTIAEAVEARLAQAFKSSDGSSMDANADVAGWAVSVGALVGRRCLPPLGHAEQQQQQQPQPCARMFFDGALQAAVNSRSRQPAGKAAAGAPPASLPPVRARAPATSDKDAAHQGSSDQRGKRQPATAAMADPIQQLLGSRKAGSSMDSRGAAAPGIREFGSIQLTQDLQVGIRPAAAALPRGQLAHADWAVPGGSCHGGAIAMLARGPLSTFLVADVGCRQVGG